MTKDKDKISEYRREDLGKGVRGKYFPQTATIRAGLAHHYAVKALFEKILGRSAFLRVKDGGSLTAWRDNYKLLLRAIDVSIEATVDVADAEWRQEVKSLLLLGAQRLKDGMSVDELHAAAAATLGELAFLQLGFVPRAHSSLDNVSLSARNWRLNQVRSVQYVQSLEQSATQTRLSKSKVVS